ncbi:MAG TPA: hypothetical protein VEU96_25345 [Bryobacteraceae bacterium]|nr:hypothetical protein [Bryobacteraceae bacterium]
MARPLAVVDTSCVIALDAVNLLPLLTWLTSRHALLYPTHVLRQHMLKLKTRGIHLPVPAANELLKRLGEQALE